MLTIGQILAILTATPQRIAELTTGLAPAQLQESLTPDQWSANQELAHLRA